MKNRDVLGFGLMAVLIAGVVLTSGCAQTPVYIQTYAPDSAGGGTPAGPPTGEEACECFAREDLSAVFGTFQEYNDGACKQDTDKRPLQFGAGKQEGWPQYEYNGGYIDLDDEEACEKHVSFKVSNVFIGFTQTVVLFPSEEEAENALSGDKDEIESWRNYAAMTSWFKNTGLAYGENFFEHYSYDSHYGTKIRYEKTAGNRMISNFFEISSHTTDLEELEEDDPLLESLVAKAKQFNRR
jgi:hypothetical protein